MLFEKKDEFIIVVEKTCAVDLLSKEPYGIKVIMPWGWYELYGEDAIRFMKMFASVHDETERAVRAFRMMGASYQSQKHNRPISPNDFRAMAMSDE